MIRVFVCIRKLAHLSDEQFHAHWRHPHGTLTRRLRQLRGYVQCHGIGPLPGLTTTPYLGVPMIWLDGLADLAAMTADPAFAPLQADALLLYDQQDVVWMIMRELPSQPDAGLEARRDCLNALLLLRRASRCGAADFGKGLEELRDSLRDALAGRAQCRISLPEPAAYAAAPCAYDALLEVRFAERADFGRLWGADAVRTALTRAFAGAVDRDASRGFLGQEERFI